jgi:hypothetical protein
MENLFIQGYEEEFDVPFVSFNAETGVCEISGESYLDNTSEFYDRLVNWLDQYAKEVKKPLTFNFKLTYFNTSSSKRILYIMFKLKEFIDQGGEVTANWYYDKNDIEMEEDVEDLMMIAKLDVHMIPDEKIRFDPFDRNDE